MSNVLHKPGAGSGRRDLVRGGVWLQGGRNEDQGIMIALFIISVPVHIMHCLYSTSYSVCMYMYMYLGAHHAVYVYVPGRKR